MSQYTWSCSCSQPEDLAAISEKNASKDLEPHLKERALEFDFLIKSDGQQRWHLD